MISFGNCSFQMIRESGDYVINLQTTELTITVVVAISPCADIDKFACFGLTPDEASDGVLR